MKIFVRVKPKSKVEKVVRKDAHHFEVWVKEPPMEGRANEAVITSLADYLGIPQSLIRIVSGKNSKNKIIEYHS